MWPDRAKGTRNERPTESDTGAGGAERGIPGYNKDQNFSLYVEKPVSVWLFQPALLTAIESHISGKSVYFPISFGNHYVTYHIMYYGNQNTELINKPLYDCKSE